MVSQNNQLLLGLKRRGTGCGYFNGVLGTWEAKGFGKTLPCSYLPQQRPMHCWDKIELMQGLEAKLSLMRLLSRLLGAR